MATACLLACLLLHNVFSSPVSGERMGLVFVSPALHNEYKIKAHTKKLIHAREIGNNTEVSEEHIARLQVTETAGQNWTVLWPLNYGELCPPISQCPPIS